MSRKTIMTQWEFAERRRDCVHVHDIVRTPFKLRNTTTRLALKYIPMNTFTNRLAFATTFSRGRFLASSSSIRRILLLSPDYVGITLGSTNHAAYRWCTRHFFASSSAANLQSGNPWRVLGVAMNSSTAVVRRAFVQAALQHHPDSGGSAADFVRIREAFEEIQAAAANNNKEYDGDTSHNATAAPRGWSVDELQEWYRQETGEFLSFSMTESTRQEVIQVYNDMLKGGKVPKGGYWDLARQLTERESLRGQEDDDDDASADGGPMKLLGGAGGENASIGRRKRRR